MPKRKPTTTTPAPSADQAGGAKRPRHLTRAEAKAIRALAEAEAPALEAPEGQAEAEALAALEAEALEAEALEAEAEALEAAAVIRTLDDVVFLAITADQQGTGVWGKGRTPSDALRKAGKPTKYVLFLATHDSYVTDLGYISYPKPFAPREIARVPTDFGMPKDKDKDK